MKVRVICSRSRSWGVKESSSAWVAMTKVSPPPLTQILRQYWGKSQHEAWELFSRKRDGSRALPTPRAVLQPFGASLPQQWVPLVPYPPLPWEVCLQAAIALCPQEQKPLSAWKFLTSQESLSQGLTD